MIHPSEALIQCAIVDYLTLMASRHRFLFFSVPNEAMVPKDGKKLSGAEYGRVNRLRRMGLTAGVSDIVLVHAGRAYFLECKKPSGQLTEHQKQFRQRVFDCGAEYIVVRSVDEVITALKIWKIIK